MFYYAIATLHVIVCVILVLVVLLQSGKGADLAGAFGGGATQTAFGSRGPASFLSKMTTIAAVVFMMTSIALSMISTPATDAKSVMDSEEQKTSAPAEQAPAAQPATAVPTPEEIRRNLEELEKQKSEAAPAASQEQQQDSNPTESN
jgi:preprotein translocase subunit SecG